MLFVCPQCNLLVEFLGVTPPALPRCDDCDVPLERAEDVSVEITIPTAAGSVP